MRRDVTNRLARLADQIEANDLQGPVCRFHGRHCRMGASWPLPYPGTRQDIELLEWVRACRVAVGEPVEPDPRDVWATDRHERVPQAELDQEKREYEELLASLQARNDQIEAELRAGRMSEGAW